MEIPYSLRLLARKARRYRELFIRIIMYPFDFFISKEKSLWLFGNSLGYRDNSRYLFEYVTENHPEIKAVWIANNEDERTYIEEFGGKALVIGRNPKSFRVVAKSEVAIVSMGVADISEAILKSTALIHLFHGIPFKNIGLDTEPDKEIIQRFSFLNSLNGYVLKKNLMRFDLLFSASSLCQDRFSTSFGLPKERIRVSGQPRTDILINGCQKPHEKEECKNLPDRFILYVPTWRESGKNPVDFFTLNRWDQLLEDLNFELVIKLHPLTKISEQQGSYKNIEFLTDSNIEFTHLLYHTDVLITDYSSAMFDYALLERPLFIFAPDAEEYEKTRGLYEPIENLGEEIIFKTEDELLDAIKEGVQDPWKFVPYTKRISERYNGFSDGTNCERVVEYVKKQINGV